MSLSSINRMEMSQVPTKIMVKIFVAGALKMPLTQLVLVRGWGVPLYLTLKIWFSRSFKDRYKK